jgi:hypothetical protein
MGSRLALLANFVLSVVLATLLTGLLTGQRDARADDATTAEALFQSAKQLSEAGQWVDACPKFKASFELDPQLGVLLNVAHCWEEVGQVAKAWTRWTQAVEWAKREGDSRLAWIEGRLSKVVPRLPKLIFMVKNPVAELRLYNGDTLVPPASYELPLAVDPGLVHIEVRRGDNVIERQEVKAVEGKTTSVALDLAAIDAAHPPAAEPEPQSQPPDKPDPAAPKKPYDATQRSVGYIVGAVGLAAVLAAVGLEIAALVKKGQADEPDACVNKFCSQQGLDAAEDGATFAEVGQWLGIGGLAAVAIGVTIVLTAPSEDDDQSAKRELWLAPSAGGLVLGGTL